MKVFLSSGIFLLLVLATLTTSKSNQGWQTSRWNPSFCNFEEEKNRDPCLAGVAVQGEATGNRLTVARSELEKMTLATRQE